MKIEDITTLDHHAIVEDLPFSDYCQTIGLNPSSLTGKSPKHIKHAYENNSPSSDAQIKGQMAHTLSMQPELFHDEFAIYGGKVRRGKEWDAFQRENTGATCATEKMVDAVQGMAEAVRLDPVAAEFIKEGVSEVSMFSVEQGLQVKGRLDWIDTQAGNLVDLKFVASIDDHKFGSSFVTFGYGLKLACYRRWFERESGKKINRVILITCEQTAPYDVACVPIPENVLEIGWDAAERAITRVKSCIESGLWPGIAGGAEYQLRLPAWAIDAEILTGWQEETDG